MQDDINHYILGCKCLWADPMVITLMGFIILCSKQPDAGQLLKKNTK